MYEIISGFKMLVLLTVSESQDIDFGLKVKSSIQYGNALPTEAQDRQDSTDCRKQDFNPHGWVKIRLKNAKNYTYRLLCSRTAAQMARLMYHKMFEFSIIQFNSRLGFCL